MLTKNTVENVLRAALSTGGDFAELFFEDADGLTLSMLDGRIEDAAASRIHGAGVRILQGNRSVYACCSDTSERALVAAAKQAAAALSGLPSEGDFSFRAQGYAAHSPIAVAPSSVPHEKKISLMRQAHRVTKESSQEISQVAVRLLEKTQRVLVANSEGLWGEDERVRTRAMVQAVASNGTEFQTGYAAPGYTMGFEVFSGTIDFCELGREAARQAVTMLHAPECPSGFVPVVIDGGFGGVIFHEACGHALEATAVAKGNSVFCGKLGQKIAADCVTAVDDGTLAGQWGTLDMDDEGLPTQRNVLIENGILKGYLIDRLGARRMGMKPTGSGRRQGYTFAPTSRMNNTFIAPGTDDEEAMIATMGEGLYAKNMGGGSVNPMTGEFNFAVSEGYWVRDGKILHPVRGATLIGKGADVIQKIDRVGPRMWLGTGMCGSLSGSVPTCVGQPRIRVQGITVGGKGGAL